MVLAHESLALFLEALQDLCSGFQCQRLFEIAISNQTRIHVRNVFFAPSSVEFNHLRMTQVTALVCQDSGDGCRAVACSLAKFIVEPALDFLKHLFADRRASELRPDFEDRLALCFNLIS